MIFKNNDYDFFLFGGNNFGDSKRGEDKNKGIARLYKININWGKNDKD